MGPVGNGIDGNGNIRYNWTNVMLVQEQTTQESTILKLQMKLFIMFIHPKFVMEYHTYQSIAVL